MSYIPDDLIDQIRASSDIVSVISDYVRLKKQGRNYTGLCPFHAEKTPSFMVSPDKQIFRCFGCGEGGNVFSFIMKRENMSFPEAARLLAQKAGITIPETNDREHSARVREQNQAFEINELARDFYQHIFKSHDTAGQAREYLANRGITPETIDKFQIGFAPPNWDSLLQFMRKKGVQAETLEKLGLVLPRVKGKPGFYDRFRNRIIFPVWNIQGKVVGFGGRVMDDSVPKYLNSPETILFNKSYLLYGINKAAESIRALDQAIIVEGYMDVISCHQAGITNVVASLGTAFTREQGKLLLRYTREVIMAYDTDSAGVNATMRGWQLLNDIGCRVRVVSIPEGKDPDEFIRNFGAEKFRKIISTESQSLSDYKTDRAMEKYDIHSLEGKFKIASEVIPAIINLSNEIEKDEAIIRLSQRLHLSPEAIRAEVEKTSKKLGNIRNYSDKNANLRDNNNAHYGKARANKDARTEAEDSLLVLMLEDKELFLRIKAEIGVHFSSRPEYVNIIKFLDEMVEKESDYQPAAIFDYIKDEATTDFLSSLSVKEIPVENRARLIEDCLRLIKEDDVKRKREELLRQMEEADKAKDQELRNKLLLEYAKLI